MKKLFVQPVIQQIDEINGYTLKYIIQSLIVKGNEVCQIY